MSSASPVWVWPRALGPGVTADAGDLPWQDEDEDQAYTKWEEHTNEAKSPVLLPKSPLHTPKTCCVPDNSSPC